MPGIRFPYGVYFFFVPRGRSCLLYTGIRFQGNESFFLDFSRLYLTDREPVINSLSSCGSVRSIVGDRSISSSASEFHNERKRVSLSPRRRPHPETGARKRTYTHIRITPRTWQSEITIVSFARSATIFGRRSGGEASLRTERVVLAMIEIASTWHPRQRSQFVPYGRIFATR